MKAKQARAEDIPKRLDAVPQQRQPGHDGGAAPQDALQDAQTLLCFHSSGGKQQKLQVVPWRLEMLIGATMRPQTQRSKLARVLQERAF